MRLRLFPISLVIVSIAAIAAAAALNMRVNTLSKSVETLSLGVQELHASVEDLRSGRVRIANDAYLDLPALVLKDPLPHYVPRFTQSLIRYTGNTLHAEFPDHMYVLRQLTKDDHEVVFSEGPFMSPGQEFEILEDRLFDFKVSGTFVKVRRTSDFAIGYLSMETFAGETVPVTVPPAPTPYPLVTSAGGVDIYLPFSVSKLSTQKAIEDLSRPLPEALSTPLTKGTIHPVTAANTAMVLLSHIVGLKGDDPLRAGSLPLLAFLTSTLSPRQLKSRRALSHGRTSTISPSRGTLRSKRLGILRIRTP